MFTKAAEVCPLPGSSGSGAGLPIKWMSLNEYDRATRGSKQVYRMLRVRVMLPPKPVSAA